VSSIRYFSASASRPRRVRARCTPARTAPGNTAARADGLIARLTERQQEVFEAALAVGYYANPRDGTHADVTERVGCSASTAGEHLRKIAARVFSQFSDGPAT